MWTVDGGGGRDCVCQHPDGDRGTWADQVGIGGCLI